MKNLNKLITFKVNQIFRFLSISLVLTACNNDQPKPILSQFNSNVSLTIYKEVELTDLFNPISFHIMDNVLVIRTMGRDGYLFSVVDTTHFNEISRFGYQRSGPDEIGGIAWVSRINEDSLLVLDAIKFKVFVFSVQNILNGNNKPIKTIDIRDANEKIRSISMIMNNDGSLIGTGIHPQGRYALYNENGLNVGYYIEYPKLEIESKNTLLKPMAFQSVFAKQPNGNFFASLSNGALIDILEYQPNDGINLIRRINFFDTNITLIEEIEIDGISVPRVASFGLDTMIGFEDFHFQATSSAIFALFSERPYKDFFGIHSTHNRRLYRNLVSFDWEGNPKFNFEFDKDVYGFTICEKYNKFFLLSYSDKGLPTILVAKLFLT